MEDSLDPRNPFSRLCKFSRVTGELNLSKIAIGPFEDRERSVDEMDSATRERRDIPRSRRKGLEIKSDPIATKAGSSGGKRNNANVISVDDRTCVRATVGEKRATGSLPRTPSANSVFASQPN